MPNFVPCLAKKYVDPIGIFPFIWKMLWQMERTRIVNPSAMNLSKQASDSYSFIELSMLNDFFQPLTRQYIDFQRTFHHGETSTRHPFNIHCLVLYIRILFNMSIDIILYFIQNIHHWDVSLEERWNKVAIHSR
jgi:hypothetical protein